MAVLITLHFGKYNKLGHLAYDKMELTLAKLRQYRSVDFL